MPLQTNRKLDSESITQSKLITPALLEAAHLEKDSGTNVWHVYTSLYTVLGKYSTTAGWEHRPTLLHRSCCKGLDSSEGWREKIKSCNHAQTEFQPSELLYQSLPQSIGCRHLWLSFSYFSLWVVKSFTDTFHYTSSQRHTFEQSWVAKVSLALLRFVHTNQKIQNLQTFQ